MMHVVDSVVKDQEIDDSKMTMIPATLSQQYNDLFPSRHAVPRTYQYTHKVVNISLMLKNEGIRLKV